MSATAVTPREFVCPGQRYAIPRPVHLARMASGYAACRDCPCNERSGSLQDSSERSETASRAAMTSPRSSRDQRLFHREGIRGVFRNELTLADVEAFATALAGRLREHAEASGSGVPPRGFPVVVGHDDRPWSMPVAVAAGAALRRAGCETIDVGFASGPAFRFAVSHLDAVAGLLATGAGGDPSIAGLDAVGLAGRPLSFGGGLEPLRVAPAGRLTRRAGGRREFDANVPYEANLWRHFQDVAATTAVVGTVSPLLRRRIVRINDEVPTSFDAVVLPREAHEPGVPSERAVALIAAKMREAGALRGIWIDEDGTAARAIDHRGHLLAIEVLAAELIQDAMQERPRGTIALDWDLADRLGENVLRGREVVRSGGSAEAMAITMADHQATIGVDSSGRMWLPGPPVACDALVMLARLLRAFGDRNEF